MIRSGAPPLVLASASPRRTRILSMLGLDHVVDPAAVPEEPLAGEAPSGHVERLARLKAASVAGRHRDALVLAGDTVVVREGRILGKPDGPRDAVEMLLSLAGGVHEVLTGLALAVPGAEDEAASTLLSRVDVAEVRLRRFGRSLAEAYVATGEPLDKAGSYGIQGRGAALVTGVEGDYYTVVGLPVSGLVALLDGAGYGYAFRGLEAGPPTSRRSREHSDPHPDGP